MNAVTAHIPTVDDIIAVMERLAPAALAESWDNCGLQVGSRTWPVRKVWVALDPLRSVIAAAEQQGVDLVITHHPLLIRPISAVDVDTPLGSVIEKAVASKIAIFAAHTNLDSATDGLNDWLARALDMRECVPLLPANHPSTSRESDLSDARAGLGRIGRLEPALTVDQMIRKIKKELKLDRIQVAGPRHLTLDKVAVCSGGGGGLLETFFNSDAQAYICGDLRYHDARAAEDRGRVLIDVGHFPSEHIVVDALTQRLQSEFARSQWAVVVEGCRLEQEPFVAV